MCKNNVVSAKKVIFLLCDRIVMPYLGITDDHVKMTVKRLEVALHGAVIPAENFHLLLLVHYLLEQVEGRLH